MEALVIILLWLLIKNQLSLFQQYHYQIDRYLTYLKYCLQVKWWLYLSLIICLVFINLYGYYKEATTIFALLYFLYIIRNIKEYQQPLVYTMRLKRLLITIFTIYLLIAFRLKLKAILVLLIPVIIITAYYVCLPIELVIQSYYRKKCYHRLQESKQRIVIGGSYGKTSCKHILYDLLKYDYLCEKTKKSYNNAMGIASYVLNEAKRNELFIVEVGVDHPGELDNLLKMVQPTMTMLCAIGNQHLETFKTLEAIRKEKIKLVSNKKIISFVNQKQCRIPLHENIITYGKEGMISYEKVSYQQDGTSFVLKYNDKTYSAFIPLLGEHMVENVCGCIAICLQLGVEIETIIERIKYLSAIKHRLEIIKYEDYTLLDDSYNANVKGAKIAFEVMKSRKGFRIVMFSGVVELSELQGKCNYELGKYLSEACDLVILLGINRQVIKEGLLDGGFDKDKIIIVDNKEEGFAMFKQYQQKGCTFLIENDLPKIYDYQRKVVR